MATETRIPGLILTDHTLQLPLDHDDPAKGSIEVFAREVADPDGRDRPFLVFLQGGPGQESPRPTGLPTSPGWVGRALKDYRMLLLDQRGTGLSTPYGAPGVVEDPAADADYLTHFRADAIVRDAEAFREHLGVAKWSVLGQSFGGFCTLHYLTAFPDSLNEAFFTGGLPPVGRHVDAIYSATFATMRERNATYFRRYPDDRARLENALAAADAGEVRLPDGTPATRRLIRTIGGAFGRDGGAESLHYLLERDPRSAAFGHDLAGMLPFDGRNPLYAVIHESSYADGVTTGWSSDRVLPEDFGDESILLTGEHLFRWYFTDLPELTPYAEVADILATHPWPRLYDADALAATDVPCAAAIYVDDPFVDRELSLETGALLPGLRTWITDEYLHGGLRSSGERVLDRLIELVRNPI